MLPTLVDGHGGTTRWKITSATGLPPFPIPLDGPGAWTLASHGLSCDDACAQVGATCEEGALRGADEAMLARVTDRLSVTCDTIDSTLNSVAPAWVPTTGACLMGVSTSLCHSEGPQNTQRVCFCSYGSSTGDTTCSPCPRGTFSTTHAATAMTTCEPCSAGKWNDREGATACTHCKAGKYSSLTRQTSNTCVECGVGRYAINEGNTAAANCVECDVGRASPETGVMHNCDACSLGYWAEIGAGTCTPCDVGTYHNSSGGQASVDVCVDCTAGRASLAVAATSVDDCGSCPPGQYNSDANCEWVSPGRLAVDQGGTLSTHEQTNLTACKALCDLRAACWSVTTTDALCELKDRKLDDTKAFEASDTHQTSYRSCSGDDVCTDCPAGTYNEANGALVCDRCPAGTYGEDPAATSQTQCVACATGEVFLFLF